MWWCRAVAHEMKGSPYCSGIHGDRKNLFFFLFVISKPQKPLTDYHCMDRQQLGDFNMKDCVPGENWLHLNIKLVWKKETPKCLCVDSVAALNTAELLQIDVKIKLTLSVGAQFKGFKSHRVERWPDKIHISMTNTPYPEDLHQLSTSHSHSDRISNFCKVEKWENWSEGWNKEMSPRFMAGFRGLTKRNSWVLSLSRVSSPFPICMSGTFNEHFKHQGCW